MTSLIAVLVPLVLVPTLLAVGPTVRARLYPLLPWLPLLALLPLGFAATADAPWVLLGMRLGLDGTALPVLLLVLLAWTLAGWQAASTLRGKDRWFWSGWLGALAGMSLLLLAQDIASFYVGYAMLGLSAYLLVTHAGTTEAWRAGRVYLVMALLAEGAILVGVLLMAGQLGNADLASLPGQAELLAQTPARWLLFAGFAVKLGILPLHLWLPLAHPVAPVPASAILSGIIVKAGLMGWLRLVPPAESDPAWIGQLLLLLGLGTAFGGVALGLAQQRLKTLLAYSTISQMGLLLVAFALLLQAPGEREALLPLLGLIVLHHGLNKAALFLACGCAPGASRGRLLLFALPALALAAAPLSSGFLAKGALKEALALGPDWAWLSLALGLSSTATALLLWKGFALARTMNVRETRLHPAWPLMVAVGLIVPWFWALTLGLASVPGATKLFDAVWPLLLAAALAWLAQRLIPGRGPTLPEGDLVVVLERLAAGLLRWLKPAGAENLASDGSPGRLGRAGDRLLAALGACESPARQLPWVGLALLLLAGFLLI